jgi:hypothetical protein
MLDKYKRYYSDIYNYIAKRTEIKVDPKKIASEVYDKYHLELSFYDVSNEMLNEFILQMCLLAQHVRWN